MQDYLIITHGIKGLPYHFYTENLKVLQLSHCPNKRTLPTHEIKKLVNGLTRGFMIYGKFISLTALEKRMFPVTKILSNIPDECPF